jgi:saxitoxin biosynthesis operon SxtJ-like protein
LESPLPQRNGNELEGFHENLREQPDSKVASPRAFGLTFAALFLALGVLLWFRHGQFRIWSFLVGFIFLIIALALPGLLGPLNRVWSFVGSVLHRVMTQVLMGLVFVFAVTPVALLRRAFGGSGLALRFDPKLDSYWIARDGAVTDAESLKRQF